MEAEFWHSKWNTDEIGFHEGTPNALLVEHLAALDLEPGARIFVPLCGKARDLSWLVEQGFRVVGAELSELAVTQFFEELGVEPEVSPAGALVRYRIDGLEIFQGDLFALTTEELGEIDAIYDRAALVALPSKMRDLYSAHLVKLGSLAPYLVICFTYDQSVMDGPPFSIDEAEVRRLYSEHYDMTKLETVAVEGGLKGKCPADETVWILNRPGN